MHQIRLLRVTFETSIRPFELPLFRGAIIHKVGKEHELFHNHKNTEVSTTQTNNKLRYGYSLIQYKVSKNQNRLEPMILLLGDGVDEAVKLFEKEDLDIQLRGKAIPLKISTFDVDLFELKSNGTFYYNLFKWQALNSEKFNQYKTLESLSERIQFLEEQLVKNIMAFAIGIGWTPDEKVDVSIIEIKNEKQVRYKHLSVLCFDVKLKTNARLPEYIGLGKGVSKGFGVLRAAGGSRAKQY